MQKYSRLFVAIATAMVFSSVSAQPSRIVVPPLLAEADLSAPQHLDTGSNDGCASFLPTQKTSTQDHVSGVALRFHVKPQQRYVGAARVLAADKLSGRASGEASSSFDNADEGTDAMFAQDVLHNNVWLAQSSEQWDSSMASDNDVPEWNAPLGFQRTTWGQAASNAAAQSRTAAQAVARTDHNLSQRLAMARSQNKPYLLWVNIPSYLLRVYDTNSGEELLESRVIVGASGTQTPIFMTDVVNVKFNPDWSPPPSLQRKGKRYVGPGRNNPLGQARFSTNNSMNIYLHDTNNHALFNNKQRALSAGCVRVQEWHSLAQLLTGKSPQEVDNITSDNTIRFVEVPHSLVWISYERIDFGAPGQLVVYPDIYRKQPLGDTGLPAAQ